MPVNASAIETHSSPKSCVENCHHVTARLRRRRPLGIPPPAEFVVSGLAGRFSMVRSNVRLLPARVTRSLSIGMLQQDHPVVGSLRLFWRQAERHHAPPYDPWSLAGLYVASDLWIEPPHLKTPGCVLKIE